MTDDQPRESLNLRVPPDLKRLVVEYARRTGIPINAAAVVLLRQAFEGMGHRHER